MHPVHGKVETGLWTLLSLAPAIRTKETDYNQHDTVLCKANTCRSFAQLQHIKKKMTGGSLVKQRIHLVCGVYAVSAPGYNINKHGR